MDVPSILKLVLLLHHCSVGEKQWLSSQWHTYQDAAREYLVTMETRLKHKIQVMKEDGGKRDGEDEENDTVAMEMETEGEMQPFTVLCQVRAMLSLCWDVLQGIPCLLQ